MVADRFPRISLILPMAASCSAFLMPYRRPGCPRRCRAACWVAARRSCPSLYPADPGRSRLFAGLTFLGVALLPAILRLAFLAVLLALLPLALAVSDLPGCAGPAGSAAASPWRAGSGCILHLAHQAGILVALLESCLAFAVCFWSGLAVARCPCWPLRRFAERLALRIVLVRPSGFRSSPGFLARRSLRFPFGDGFVWASPASEFPGSAPAGRQSSDPGRRRASLIVGRLRLRLGLRRAFLACWTGLPP